MPKPCFTLSKAVSPDANLLVIKIRPPRRSGGRKINNIFNKSLFQKFLKILKKLFPKSFLSGVWGNAPIKLCVLNKPRYTGKGGLYVGRELRVVEQTIDRPRSLRERGKIFDRASDLLLKRALPDGELCAEDLICGRDVDGIEARL